MKDTFSTYHPLVNFLYFAEVLLFSMFFMHPACLLLSLCCGIAYHNALFGKKTVGFCLKYLLPVMLFTAVLNPAFNHEGATILTYFPNGNPLTLESMVYGVGAAAMLGAVVLWFACFNGVITSDKVVYLFGRIIPAMSLVLSMSLRFVPRFRAQLKVISQAQQCVGRDVHSGSVLQRVRHGITLLSVMVTWALENGIETADSMKSRGYGLPGRTAFSIYRMDGRDKTALVFFALTGGYILLGAGMGALHWRYYPTLRGAQPGVYFISLLLCYLALCLTPVILNRREERKWKAMRSGI